jgi:STE24 endopeptidase
MKWIIVTVVCIFLALFGLATFLPAPGAEAEATRYFSPVVIERGLEHSLEGKLLFWASTFVHLGALALVVLTGLARSLADVFLRWTGGRWLPAVLWMGVFLFLGDQVLSLPFALWNLEWQRAWGLTQRSAADWLVDYAKGVALSAVVGGIVVMGLYTLLRFFPRTWWALAAGGGTALAVVYAIILPIWINPLFNTFTPLEKTQWAYLQGPVRALAQRVGVPVQEILVMDASRQGSHTNAYFTGFGGTRRIVLYDTLLSSHTALSPTTVAATLALPTSPLGGGAWLAATPVLARASLGEEEVLSILAHEFGHWQHNHIVKGIAFGGVGALVGFFLLSRFLWSAIGRPPCCLKSLSDPAGLPLILLLVVLGTWCALPVENAISRVFERQADMASLELEDHADVFIEAEKRLARDNISNVAPNVFSVWLFATHPPAVERIQMAEQWRAAHNEAQGRAMRP